MTLLNSMNTWRFGLVVELVSINKVSLHLIRLVLGRVTVFGRPRHLGVQRATQVNSAWLSLHGQAQ